MVAAGHCQLCRAYQRLMAATTDPYNMSLCGEAPHTMEHWWLLEDCPALSQTGLEIFGRHYLNIDGLGTYVQKVITLVKLVFIQTKSLALRCVRCVNENRKKRKRLRWQAANHGCHCFDRAFLLAGACVCCVKKNARNACNASDCVWMETGLDSSIESAMACVPSSSSSLSSAAAAAAVVAVVVVVGLVSRMFLLWHLGNHCSEVEAWSVVNMEIRLTK